MMRSSPGRLGFLLRADAHFDPQMCANNGRRPRFPFSLLLMAATPRKLVRVELFRNDL
jgi:hypothetical protein